jgi:RNA polymerase sigma factor (sigma-70 family)
MTVDLITLSQSGDVDATLELVNKFKPLLKKYAFKLNFDDAYDDLLLDFLILIKAIQIQNLKNCSEGALITYIQKSIFNSYIKQSLRIKKLRNISLYSDLSDSELYYVESSYSNIDDYSDLEFQCFDHILTKPEALIIKMIYRSGYSASEIAIMCGISRQAVNQTKNRALKKLERLYSDKLEKIT